MRNRSLLALAGGLALLSRLALRNAGATREERRRELPGDELVPAARGGSTMAVTIDAPPSAVWPWLVQMGRDRAGFYSFDRLDNGGRPSAEEIHPEWQTLAVGDRIAASDRAWFEVAELVPERALVLRSTIDPLRGRSVESAAGRRFVGEGTWAFVLDPLPDDRTRLVVRARGVVRPRLLRIGDFLFGEPAHLVMQSRQLVRVKHLAERAGSAPAQEPIAA